MISARRSAACMATVVVVLGSVAVGCRNADPEPDDFFENTVVVWSTDDSPAPRPMPVPSGMPGEPRVEELRNATVLFDDGERIVVVGDVDDTAGSTDRWAYLLETDGRPRAVRGALQAGSFGGGTSVAGRWASRTVAPTAVAITVFTSAGARTEPTYVDPVTGLALAFAVAAEGEVLHGFHAMDADGLVTDIVAAPPPS